MMLSLPNEILHMVAEFCPIKDQASLASSCRQLYEVCNLLVYRNDVQNYGSSAVFHAITRCKNQATALRILQASAAGGTDFRQCEDIQTVIYDHFYGARLVVHSPLYLAATRGLDEIVDFLLRRGVSHDGPGGMDVSPLFGAIFARRESTALLLVEGGASVYSGRLGVTALHLAVTEGLEMLTSYLVRVKKMEINHRTRSGATLIMLALGAGNGTMVPLLVSLGANIYDALLLACHQHHFNKALKLLKAASPALRGTLQLHESVYLISFVVTQKAVGQDYAHKALIHQLLTLATSLMSPPDAESLMSSLLQESLSINCGDAEIASLLLHHGAKPQPETLIQILSALRSPLFENNKPLLLHRHPKLLQSLSVVHSHCCSVPPGDMDTLTKALLSQVPQEALLLVSKMNARGSALTAAGLRDFLGDSSDAGSTLHIPRAPEGTV